MRGLPGAGCTPPRPELLGVYQRSRSAAGQARLPSLRGLRNAPPLPVSRSGTQRVSEARNRALRRVMSRTRDPHWSLSRQALAAAPSVDLTTSDPVIGSSRGGRQTLTGHPASPCGPSPADLQAWVTGGRSPPNLGVTPSHGSRFGLEIRPPSGVMGQWLRGVVAPSSVLSGRPSSLEIRRTSSRTSGISHRHVTPVPGCRQCFLSRSLRPTVPSRDAPLPLLPWPSGVRVR